MVETLDSDRGRRSRSRPMSPSEIEEENVHDADSEEEPQLQDMDASPPHPSADEPKAPPPTVRKAGGKKIKPLTAKQRVIAQEKLVLLSDLEPHPFSPNKTDFEVAKHERPLRFLGLWDFANLQLDQEIRKDLLIELIAHHDSAGKRSLVNETRINVTRAELARALRIPNRKGVPAEELKDGDRKVFTETSTTAALVQFLLSWIVLAGEVGIIPTEAQAAIESIQSGNAPKVDWAGILWIMVEKELSEAPKSRVCYYASHLQQLMKSQKPALFEMEDPTQLEVPVVDSHPDADTHADAADAAADTTDPHDAMTLASTENQVTDDHATTKIGATTEIQATDAHDADVPCHSAEEPQYAMDVDEGKVLDGKESEKQQDVVSNTDDVADEEPLKENTTSVEEGQPHWLGSTGNDVSQHCMQRCTSTVVPSMDIEGLKEEPGIGDKDRHGDDFTSKFPNLDGSTDLLQGMDDCTDPFFPSTRQEFSASHHETQTTMSLNCGPAASPLFQDNRKRVNAEIEDEDEEEGDIHQFSHELRSKRVRTEQPWDNVPSSFNFYFEQAVGSLSKMKMAHELNQEQLLNAQMQVHYLNTEVQQKDHYIQSLEKNMLEEQQKRQVQFHHLEYEHNVMSRLVVGYQKALKETRLAFAAYRKRFPQGEEPLYKDVGVPGGIVLTARELERKHMEKLELEKQILQRRELENQFVINMVLKFSLEWSSNFENYWDKVQRFGERLKELKEKINLLSERNVTVEASPQVSE